MAPKKTAKKAKKTAKKTAKKVAKKTTAKKKSAKKVAKKTTAKKKSAKKVAKKSTAKKAAAKKPAKKKSAKKVAAKTAGKKSTKKVAKAEKASKKKAKRAEVVQLDFGLNDHVSRRKEVAWRMIDGEAVIVTPADSMMHSLNEVGTRIWELLDGSRTVAEVAAVLLAEFEVEKKRAEEDTAWFVECLAKKGLVELP